MHVHRDAAEAFLVLAGEYLMLVEGEQTRCPPGTFVFIPTGVRHTFTVLDPGRGRNSTCPPAAMVGFFEELAAAEAAGTATLELLDEIATRYHMDVVGPVPDSYL